MTSRTRTTWWGAASTLLERAPALSSRQFPLTFTSYVPRKTQPAVCAGPLTKRGEELLDTLEAIVLAEGFEHLNVSDMAARLACSKRTLYELAPSRQLLLLRVIGRFFARIRDDAASIGARDVAARQQVYDYLQIGVRAAERLSPAAVRDMQSWVSARALWQEHVALRVDGLRRIIEAGIRSGEFKDIHPAFVAEIVFASINRLREPDFCTATDLTISQAFDELYRLLLLALAADSARVEYSRVPRARSGPQRA